MTEAVPIDPGPRPELAWLQVAMLRIDSAYQRTIDGRVSQAAIARIAAEFRWACFGVVMVSTADGVDGWVIIDGQHRVEAAKRCGLTTVPCIIVPAGSSGDQARIFLATNRQRVTVNPYAMHRAQLVAGEQGALDGQALADLAGIEIPRWPVPRNQLRPGQTLALATIKQAAQSSVGTAAIILVGECWKDKAGGIPAGVLRAAWMAMDDEVPADNVRGWLGRHRNDDMTGSISQERIGEFVQAMRRSSAAPRTVAGIDMKRLMGGR